MGSASMFIDFTDILLGNRAHDG